jgi:hypothetical protein
MHKYMRMHACVHCDARHLIILKMVSPPINATQYGACPIPAVLKVMPAQSKTEGQAIHHACACAYASAHAASERARMRAC